MSRFLASALFNPPLCDSCEDTHRGGTRRFDESVPCPRCGSDDLQSKLFHERAHTTLPLLKPGDLTDAERALAKIWVGQGFHELDALRWVEGRRYTGEAMKADKEFQRRVFVEIGNWHASKDKEAA